MMILWPVENGPDFEDGPHTHTSELATQAYGKGRGSHGPDDRHGAWW